MEVLRHRLVGVPFLASPNMGGALIRPTGITIHYTAGRSAEASIATLRNPNPPGGLRKRVSAHAVVGHHEGVTQLVPFNRIAWHAGSSSWNGRAKCNDYMIGLELDNPGFLRLRAGKWLTWWGQEVPEAEVEVHRHKHGGKELGWHRFPEAQIADAYMVCEALIDAYPSIREVVGHDDIAPGRKRDPGPAFPMEQFRAWLFDSGQA